MDSFQSNWVWSTMSSFLTNTFMAGVSKVVKNWKGGNIQYIFTEWKHVYEDP